MMHVENMVVAQGRNIIVMQGGDMVVAQGENMVVAQGENMVVELGGEHGCSMVVAWLHHCGMEVHTLHSFLLPVIAMLI